MVTKFFILDVCWDLSYATGCGRLWSHATWSNRRSQQRCFVKKDALKISENSQENLRARVSFLIKSQAVACNLTKKRLYWRCFLVKCAIFSRKYFLQNTSGRLLLKRNRILITRCITNFYPIQHCYHYWH